MQVGQRDNTGRIKVLDLHTTYPGSVPGTAYGFPSDARSF